MAADDRKTPATERYSTLEVDHSSELPEANLKAADAQPYTPSNNDGSGAPEVVGVASPPQSMSMLSPTMGSSLDPRYSYNSVPGYANSSSTPGARFSYASTPYAPLNAGTPVNGAAAAPLTPLEGAEVKSGVEHGRQRTICGIPRRTFWLCLSIVLVFIAAAAIGGGVGGALGSRKSSSSSSSSSNSNDSESGRGTGAGNVTTTTRLLSKSNLAAVNYTDGSGVEHHRLYYQTASLDIAAAEWDSASGNWSSPAVVRLSGDDADTKIKAKNGTPIAAYVYWRADGHQTFQLAFLDKTNLIRAYTSNISSPTTWSLSSADSLVRAAPGTSLAAYATGCSVCLTGAHWLLYQDDDGSVNVLAMQNSSSSSSSSSASSTAAADETTGTWNAPLTILPSAVPGTSLAAVPIFPVQANEPKAAVYANANTLQEIYFIPSASPQWEPLTSIADSSAASAALGAGAAIAAFARDVADVLYIAVLTTKSGGGVAVTWWDGAKAAWGRVASVAGMEGVSAGGALVASQAGRVYGFADGGVGAQVTEWRFAGGVGQGDAAGAAKWERVGVVPLA
ncbi:uncharacterized protein IWZ02DRAFT_436424 [Phyllosticta citriasiana]|uniref:uncharacterized protein n=1 Tax=Phyllosticta citriasiana TaxID=595635 RepID=UPI0030FD575B